MTACTLGELLQEIIDKKGPHNLDRLQQAENIIEHASKNATEIKKRLVAALNSLYNEAVSGSADIEMGIQGLLESVEAK